MSHWDACEADFQRFYQLDLRDEIDGSPRRLWALVNNLPSESAVLREMQGDQGQPEPSSVRPDPFRSNVTRISPAELGRWLPTG